MKPSHLILPTDYSLAFSMEKVGPLLFRQCQHCLFAFSACFWVLRHPGEGLVELEASGSTSIGYSFQKVDISNELVPDKVSAFARSLVTSQHLTLPLISPALSFSSETGKERKKKSEVRQQSKSQIECGIGAD